MSNLDSIIDGMPKCPSVGYVKIASLAKAVDSLDSLEKTAEVSNAVMEKKAELFSAFKDISPSHSLEEIPLDFIKKASFLIKAQDLEADMRPYADSLNKLATVGVIDHKLQEAAKTCSSPDALEKVSELMSENTNYGAHLLVDMVKTANPFSRPPKLDAGGVKSIAGAFGGGGSSGSGGGFMGKLKGMFSGGSDNAATSLSKGIAGRGSASSK